MWFEEARRHMLQHGGADADLFWESASFHRPVASPQQQLQITSLGSSASAQRASYVSHLATWLGDRQLTTHNMAQGYATSDYALSFLDSLVPPCPNASATHLLLWEFAINDSEMSAEWRRELFPLFLRRAAHLVPHATLCFVVLWPSYARHCFPACPRRLAVWADLTAALARATHRRVFAINVNRLAERMGNHSALFADRHHPSSAGHQMIAGALAAHEAYAAFTHYLTSRAASLLHLKPSLPARAIRLAAPLPSEGAIRLHGHAAKPALAAVGAFLNGTQPVSVDAGLSDSKRVDRKTLLWIPACAYGAATYAVGLRFTFVGLNLVLPARGQLYRLRNRSEVSVAAWAYSPHGRLVVSDLSAFDDVPLALKSGLSPIVPQLWFRWDLAEAHGQDEARAFTNWFACFLRDARRWSAATLPNRVAID
ncbi:hypothetical protein AB1Y20_012262 [Prymnesium parvum]|uniref:SGNH hydrolase-type esterase domain-containing protein n=1 Tax=Prymnesium parvum TaxID=97485 RepID=A0AB34IQ39_PRYPA